MSWTEAALLLPFWLLGGVALAWRARRIGGWLKARPRSLAVFLASGGFILSLAILVGGVAVVAQSGGLSEDRPGWVAPAVAVIGLVFVAGQTLSALAMATLIAKPSDPAPIETTAPATSSNSQETQSS